MPFVNAIKSAVTFAIHNLPIGLAPRFAFHHDRTVFDFALNRNLRLEKTIVRVSVAAARYFFKLFFV
jgi:hypothetical protein